MSTLETPGRAASVPHFVKGRTVTAETEAAGTSHGDFFTPRLDLDELVWPRI